MSERIEKSIIGIYSRRMTTSDICDQIKEIYGIEVSEETISNVTNRIIETCKRMAESSIRTDLFCYLDGWNYDKNKTKWKIYK